MSSEHFHESFSREEDDVRSSDRTLGITFAAVCAIVGLIKLYRGGAFPISWSLAAAAFLLCAFFWTPPLRLLGILWHGLGHVLFKVVNPVIMAILFYGTIAPIGFLLRLAKSDPLRLAIDRDSASYWLEREPPGPDGRDMKNQF
jgi:hypothetical protein